MGSIWWIRNTWMFVVRNQTLIFARFTEVHIMNLWILNRFDVFFILLARSALHRPNNIFIFSCCLASAIISTQNAESIISAPSFGGQTKPQIKWPREMAQPIPMTSWPHFTHNHCGPSSSTHVFRGSSTNPNPQTASVRILLWEIDKFHAATYWRFFTAGSKQNQNVTR